MFWNILEAHKRTILLVLHNNSVTWWNVLESSMVRMLVSGDFLKLTFTTTITHNTTNKISNFKREKLSITTQVAAERSRKNFHDTQIIGYERCATY